MTTTHVPKVANDMRSLNVRTESGVQLFGFDAELYLKRKAQEDPERSKKILEWVETVSGMNFYDKSNLFGCLKSGIHLCMVIQKTFPELIKKVNKSSNAQVLRKRESTVHLELDNLKMFSNACETLGIPVFDPHEFHEGGISDPIMNSIEHFAKLANQTHPTTVPSLNLQGKPNAVTSPRRVSLVWPPPRPTSSEGDVEQSSSEGEKSENIQTKAPRRLSDPPSKNWVPRRRSNTVDDKQSPNTHRRNKSEQMNRDSSPPPKKPVKVVKIVTKKKVDSSKTKSEGDVKKKVEKIEQNSKEEIKPTASVTAASKEKEKVVTNKNNNGGGFSKSLYFGLGVIFGVGLSFAYNFFSKKPK